MRAARLLFVSAAILAVAGATSAADAGQRGNPNGWGLYSPDHGAYRYDKRSWYYLRPGYYPYYASQYWVPRSEMRTRYRYLYTGPKYRYYPAWGYPRPGHYAGSDSHFGSWNTPFRWNW
jgi:hypothetical protein